MQSSSPTNRNTATNMQEEHTSSTPPMPSPTPHASTTPSTNSSLTTKTANIPHQNLTAPADMQSFSPTNRNTATNVQEEHASSTPPMPSPTPHASPTPNTTSSLTTKTANMPHQNLTAPADMQNSSPTNRNTATNVQEEHTSSSTPPMPSPTPHASPTPNTTSSLTTQTANIPHQNLTAPADMQNSSPTNRIPLLPYKKAAPHHPLPHLMPLPPLIQPPLS
ncbi:hypothetical protein [Bartonella raoultii]|uniref:hypothetical protein n=1 Tax=Bartonella raoultii TaxID=1457020 RepID=UPI001ABA22CF|nr:hypothetical protein [Bartonella raoultii]